jgi:hypothetical protein
MMKVYFLKAIRLSEVACLNHDCAEIFVFPPQWMTYDSLINGVLLELVGFETYYETGAGKLLNFIASNLM